MGACPLKECNVFRECNECGSVKTVNDGSDVVRSWDSSSSL